jgi:hypothetical protein
MKEPLPHLRPVGSSTQLVVDGQPFIMLAGEVRNSSSSSLAYMEERVWSQALALHCNTVLVPVSWELLEPVEGQWDFALLDELIGAARRRGLRLVLLWFGAWKNAQADYAPGWVKTNLQRFPRAQSRSGANLRSLSCVSESGCAADGRAFAALMRRVRQVDGDHHTVVMVQVENEAGLLGSRRDYSPQAEARFREAVPAELMSYLATNRDTLTPEFRESSEKAGNRMAGTWAEVFGEGADEAFMAWHVGRYVDNVAQAGQAEYPLPMFVNAWLVQHAGEQPGEYPSGGPVARMMDVWRCAAPHIACLAPDIYLDDFAATCAQYARSGNPLLIAETRRDETAAANVFYAVGEHNALCFSPFGIENMAEGRTGRVAGASPEAMTDSLMPGEGARLAKCYDLLEQMMPVVAAAYGADAMRGILQGSAPVPVLELGDYRVRVRFNEPRQAGKAPGGGLIIALSEGEYVVAGHGFGVEFLSRPDCPPNVDYLYHEEGTYRGGQWTPRRRLNGDEDGCPLGEDPEARHIRVYSYR